MVQQARAANPQIQIIARAHFDTEVEHLARLGADIAIMGEREIARGMIEQLLSRQSKRGAHRQCCQQKIVATGQDRGFFCPCGYLRAAQLTRGRSP
jgi:ferredoxin-thioredoxin reductase catalytic subunit